MKVVDYMVASTSGGQTYDHARTVMKLIAEGWQPFGGVCYEGGRMLQAMVKYETYESVTQLLTETAGVGGELPPAGETPTH